VQGEIHLVIIATPNQSHGPLAHEALARGAHVLIEKPFVTSPEEGRRLVEAGVAAKRVIAVNQTRRFLSLTGDLRRRISEGAFGALRSIVHREGTKLTWPFESGAAFARDAQRTGVIMDFGVHVIDFYHYLLLQPAWSFVSAIHDGFDGPEGLAEIELRAGEAPVSLRLSRYHTQENVGRLVFERAVVAFDVYDTRTYSICASSGKVTSVTAEGAVEYSSYADAVLLNFVAASENREPAVCDAASSLPVVALLDEVYRGARRYPAGLGSA
jgi:predicted dehydrogenase